MSEMTAAEYCERVGLQVPVAGIDQARASLTLALDDAKSASVPSTPKSLARLYEFKVPKLSADGSCARFDDLAAAPYDLTEIFGGRTFMTTTRLMTLDVLVEHVERELSAGWLGVYQARETPRGNALVKLAYRGAASRAEFLLTAEFAAKSNNSTVAMTGKASVVNDLQAHLKSGGSYYERDPKVRSEACLPVIKAGAVIGVIDAEHTSAHQFTATRLAMLAALAIALPAFLPSGGLSIS